MENCNFSKSYPFIRYSWLNTSDQFLFQLDLQLSKSRYMETQNLSSIRNLDWLWLLVITQKENLRHCLFIDSLMTQCHSLTYSRIVLTIGLSSDSLICTSSYILSTLHLHGHHRRLTSQLLLHSQCLNS
jgi:hypothetical protein